MDSSAVRGESNLKLFSKNVDEWMNRLYGNPHFSQRSVFPIDCITTLCYIKNMNCKLCNKEFKMITNTHLKKDHGIDTLEYKAQFGQDSLNDEVMRAKITASRYHVFRPRCSRDICNNTVTQSWNKYCSYECSNTARMSKVDQNGDKNPFWRGGWYSIGKVNKQLARERDNYNCRNCNKKVSGKVAHVHHMVPERCFDDPELAHDLSNLVTLCGSCHLKVEWSTFRELHDRALKLDELLKDDPSHTSFEEYKNNLLPEFTPLPQKLQQDIKINKNMLQSTNLRQSTLAQPVLRKATLLTKE